MLPRFHFANPCKERADKVSVGVARCNDFNLRKFPSGGQIRHSSEFNLILNAAVKLTCAELFRPIQEIAVILTLSWLGKQYLIGFALFSSLAIISGTFLTSVVNATEALMLNSQNARNSQLTWSWMQLGFILGILLMLPVGTLWWFSESVLTFMGFDSHHAHLAAKYGRIFIAAAVADVWASFLYRFTVVKRQSLPFFVVESTYTMILIFILLVAIWGAAGFSGFGFEGAAYARIFCSWLRLGFYGIYARAFIVESDVHIFEGTYWSMSAFHRLLQLTAHHILSQSLSEWIMPVFMFIAALHDINLLAPMMLLEMIAFLLLGIAQGLATANGARVGYFLLTGLAHHAYTAWKAAFTLTLPVAVTSGVIALYLPSCVDIFSNNHNVRHDVKNCKYLLAGLATLVVFVSTYSSILFQQGRITLLYASWISNWGIALPTAVLGLRHFHLELHSFWVALCFGLILDVVVQGCVVLFTDWQTVAEKCRLKQAEIAKAKGLTDDSKYQTEKEPLSGLTENLLAQNYNAIVGGSAHQPAPLSESSVEDLRVARPEYAVVKVNPQPDEVVPDEMVLSRSIDSASTVEDLCVRRPDFSVIGRNTVSRQRAV